VVESTLTNSGPRIYSVVTRDEKNRKLIVKIVNGTSNAEPLTIKLDHAGKVGAQAKLITLSGKTPNATNSITNPNVVVPVESTVAIAGPSFVHSFAPYSVNVLELSY
jgi:alpha-N-arabinofuranosidase